MLPRTRRAVLSVAATGAVALSLVAPAVAASSDVLHADTAVARSCFAELLPSDAEGADRREVTSTVNGLVQVRLTGAAGDWDVAVFDRATSALVVASTTLNAREFAEAFVTDGQQLVVQACRYAGAVPDVPVGVDFVATTPTGPSETAQLVRVATPERADKDRLLALDLDVTEHADADSVDVVLGGGADRRVLQDNGFGFTVLNPDLTATAKANAEEDAEFAATTERSELPSGRTSYRALWDYAYEMKELARLHPDLVRVFTLPHLTVEGREVVGAEIATNVATLGDGKPVSLTLGLHHAREWPSGEHALEWAYDLVQGYTADAEIRGLVERTRSIIVPVVNPDGFAVSREAPANEVPGTYTYDWKRKNCGTEGTTSGQCRANAAGRLRGTDLNRNYGGFWGGVGTSPQWDSDTFRGTAPFSEPETRNVRDLVSSRQVTNLLTLHTDGGQVLRVPGLPETRETVDEPAIRALGDLMASRNGYLSLRSWELYSIAGTAEDWSYWATGGLAYTMEIGEVGNFHPPFAPGVVAEYVGKAPAAGAGKGGNRRAFLDVLANAATPEAHSTLVGTALAGYRLSLRKAFQTPTSRLEQVSPLPSLPPLLVKDVLDSKLTAPGGRFEWAVNPSTRPYVGDRLGREPQAPAQPGVPLVNPPGFPPVAGPAGPTSPKAERIPFTASGLPQHDNGKVTVSVSWADSGARWRVYIVDAAGGTVAETTRVSPTTSVAVLADPPPGEYTAVVLNGGQPSGRGPFDWFGSVEFAGPVPPLYGTREPYALTCADPSGRTVGTTDVYVDRGQVVDLGDVCAGTGGR